MSSALKTEVSANIHSIESCGTVDGPGIRYVFFLQGCPLRCLYCHNPDTRSIGNGKIITVQEAFHDILKYQSYFQYSGGGVTFSGGEPLLQPEFIFELSEALRHVDIHTALDTSGFPSLNHPPIKKAVDEVDLVLLSIKNFDPVVYHRLTHVNLTPTLEMAEYLAKENHPTWIRYVLVPHLTDNLHSIKDLAHFLSPMKNVKKVQILPFHKMGEFKWKQMAYQYELENTPPPTPELIQQVSQIFREQGLAVE